MQETDDGDIFALTKHEAVAVYIDSVGKEVPRDAQADLASAKKKIEESGGNLSEIASSIASDPQYAKDINDASAAIYGLKAKTSSTTV